MTPLTSLRLTRATRLLGLLIAFYAVLIYPACGGTEVEDEFDAFVDPDSSTIEVGQSILLTAEAFVPSDDVRWTADPGAAISLGEALVDTVGVSGVSYSVPVTGVRLGTETVTATFFLNDARLGEVSAEVAVVEDSGGGLVEGTYDLGVSGVEAVYRVGTCFDGGGTTSFGSLSLSCAVAYAYDDGFGVFDFRTQTTVYQQGGISGSTGALFAAAPVSNAGHAAFILAGQTGDGFADTDGNRSLAFGPTAFDAFPAWGDPATGWVSTAGPGRGACTYGPDAGSSFGFNRLNCIPSSTFEGELVSGFRLRAGLDSPSFWLTRGVTSNLYYDDGTGGAAELSLTVGLDARRVRCGGDGAGNYLCGITLFGDDQVGLFTYTAGGNPAFVGNIDVADGPVDLSVRYRTDGTYDLLTSGFNDNRLAHLNLNANGTLNARTFRDGPSGCMGLGHVTYLTDEDDGPFAGSCFTSGQAFLQLSF